MKTGENETLTNAHAMLALAVQGLGLGLLDLPACIDTHYRCLMIAIMKGRRSPAWFAAGSRGARLVSTGCSAV
jgi:hypothetical protein